MIKKVVNSHRGMKKDLSKSKHSPEFYYDALNMRLLSNDATTLGAIQNESGNILKFSLPTLTHIQYVYTWGTQSKTGYEAGDNITMTPDRELGIIEIDNGVVIFATYTANTIFGVANRKVSTIWKYTASTNLLDLVYADDYTYYIDKTQLDFDNSKQIEGIANYENNGVYKVYWIDGIHQPRNININASDSLLIPIETLDMLPIVTSDFGDMLVDKAVGGSSLKAGVIQFAYSLYKMNGPSSKPSPLTSLYTIDGLDRGLDVNEQSNTVFNLTIDIGTNINIYDSIKVYAIKRDSLNGAVSVDIIYDTKAQEVNYFSYNGSAYLSTITGTGFIALGGDYIVPNTMAQKDSRLFFANYESDDLNIATDVRAFAFDQNLNDIPDFEKTSKIYVTKGGSTLFVNNDFSNLPVLDSDCINYDYEFYKYTLTEFQHGAEGPNIKLEIRYNQSDSLVDTGISSFSDYQVIDIKTYRAEQIYRFGLEAMDEFGRWSPVKWVCDYKIPSHQEMDLEHFSYAGGTINFIRIGVKISIKNRIQFTNNTYASKIRLVRTEVSQIDRIPLTTGFVNSTIFEGSSRLKATTHGMPDYFQRFIGEYYTDNEGVIGELDIKNSKTTYARKGNREMMCNFRRLSIPNLAQRGTEFDEYYRLKSYTSSGGVLTDDNSWFMCELSSELSDSFDAIRDINRWDTSDSTSGYYQCLNNDRRIVYMDSNIVNLYSPETITGDISSIDKDSCDIYFIGFSYLGKSNGDGTQDTLNYGLINKNTILDLLNTVQTFMSGIVSPLTSELFTSVDQLSLGVLANTTTSINGLYETNEYIKNKFFSSNIECYTTDYKLRFNGSATTNASKIKIEQPSFIEYIDTYLGSRSITLDGPFTSGTINYQPELDTYIESSAVSGKSPLYGRFAKNITFDLGTFVVNGGTFVGINALFAHSASCYGPYIRKRDAASPYAFSKDKLQPYQNYMNLTSHENIVVKNVDMVSNIFYNQSAMLYDTLKEGYFFADPINHPSHGPEITGYSDDTAEKRLGIPMVMLKRKPEYYEFIYGGNSFSAKSSNKYIPCTEPIVNSIAANDTSWDGDCWLSPIQILRTFSMFGETSPYSDRSDYFAEAVTYLGESWSNWSARTDLSKQLTNLIGDVPDTFYKFNTVYNQPNNFLTSFPLDSRIEEGRNNSRNTIIATDTKIPGEFIDSWTNILLNEFQVIEGNYGAINKLQELGGQIFAIQDKAVCHLIINPRVQIQASDGKPVELGTGELFSDYRYISTLSGSLQKWSIVKGGLGIYYYDALNKALMLFNGQTVDNIGLTLGMGSVFSNDITTLNDSPIYGSGVKTFFNPITRDLYITVFNTSDHSNPVQSYTLALNENTKSFTSYYSYLPSLYSMIGDSMYTIPLTGGFYQHDALTAIHNVFYGTYYPSNVTYLLNPEPFSEKTFTNHEFEADVYLKDINGIYQDSNTIYDTVQAFSDYQSSNATALTTNYLNRNLSRKFRTWRIILPRTTANIATPMNRMQDHYIFSKLVFNKSTTPTADYKLIMHDLITSYIVY